MFTWPRDFVRHLAAARTELTFAWLAVLGFLVGGCSAARGGEPAEAQTKAALALAKAKRDREANCFSDYDAAAAQARRTGKPLVLWVGVKCSEHPKLRAELADAVHCHVAEASHDRTPRVTIRGADGTDWFVRPEKIGPETAKKLREKWQAAPPVQPGVGGELYFFRGGACPPGGIR